MAKVALNPSLAVLRGTVDGWTYRSDGRGGMTVYAHQPSTKPASSKQKAGRRLFREAQGYAKSVLEDPLHRIAYQRLARARKLAPNNLLVSMYMNPPTIDTVELAGYTGVAGGMIRILALDAVEVVGVTVTIRTGTGAVAESGEATRQHDVWTYRSRVSLPADTAWQVEVKAKNRADREGKVTVARPLAAATSPTTG